MELYNIPFYQKSKLKWSMRLIYIVGALCTLAFCVLFFYLIMEDSFISGLLFGVFFLILTIFFIYIYVTVDVLKIYYIKFTSEYIEVSAFPFKIFKPVKAYWKDIYEVNAYEFKNNTMITILLKKDLNKKRSRTISSNFNKLYSIPEYSFQIPLTYFSDIDADRFISTVDKYINKAEKQNQNFYEDTDKIVEENSNSILKAIISAVMTSIFIGFIYGMTIHLSDKNFVVIPIFGCFIIISVFNKYFIEKSFSILNRLLVGLICLLQVPVSIVTFIDMRRMASGFDVKLNDLLIVYKYFTQSIKDYILLIIMAGICFFIGAIKGRTKKENMKGFHARKSKWVFNSRIFNKRQIGMDIFNEKFIITGYEFKDSDLYTFEQLFINLNGLDNLNINERKDQISKLFRKISKSLGFSFFKPEVFLSVPVEFMENNWDKTRDQLTKLIFKCGWGKVYFAEEVILAAIGCDLPYNKLKSNGLYAKSIFIYNKKNSVTFCIGCAGGIFEKCIFPFSLDNIDQEKFEKIIDSMTRKDIEIPDSFVRRGLSKEVRNTLKLSWDADVDKTIYLMTSDKGKLLNKFHKYEIVAPSGYETFILHGLETVIKELVAGK